MAAGFVIWRTVAGTSRVEYLLLTNAERGEVGFAKGHAEEGEDPVTTARRETAEETGLTDLDVAPNFRRELVYPAERGGVAYRKTVVYGLARWRRGTVAISPEHSDARWLPYSDASAALPFATLRGVLRQGALWIRDRDLLVAEPASEAEALAHLRAQSHAMPALEAHLRGGARIARRFADALRAVGVEVEPEAAAVATLLHDVGRARGVHLDHPRAGLAHLRETRFAPYAAACWTHFTKGAPPEVLARAGVPEETLTDVASWIDPYGLSWEERCAAVADSCMAGDRVVRPDERFADLRRRYPEPPSLAVIDVQETWFRRRLEEMRAALGTDPLRIAGVA